MAEDLATIVDAARTRAFVGRTAELASFEAALDGRAPYRVMLVHGAGGLGKTALLHQFRVRAQAAGRTVVSVDGEDVDGSPEGLGRAVRAIRSGGPSVLLIDGYERLSTVDDWVRDRLVASLPQAVVVVLAGRNPPAPAWRTDPGWRTVAECLPLDVLDPVESRHLLAHAGVPDEHRGRLARIGRGHPLTLAMLADAAGAADISDDLAEVPDLVAALATRLVDEAPDDDHALAMALCAHGWLTTQDVIDELLGRRAPEVWAWLETRPWVTRGTYGVYPHDLVRDVLDADLRRRSPATYRRVHRTFHEHSWTALRSPDESERRLWAHQKLFLHRRSPLAVSFWTLRQRGTGIVAPGRVVDHPAVLELVERFEGTKSANLAARWLDAQPENLSVVPSATGTGIDAFALHTLHPADPALVDGDPVVQVALDTIARTSPARPGEQVTVARFFGGHAGYQRDPYAVVVGSVSSTVLWTTRALAWSFVATTDPEFWGPIFTYLALTTQLHVEYSGRSYTLYGIDWRRLPPERWYDLLGERELTGESGPAPASLLRSPPLSRERFKTSLRAALRDLHRPDRLQDNELMGSRLAMDLDAVSARRLRRTLVAGIERVACEPRSESLGRVLDRTYVHAAPTQEAAAEVLGLPFSTYRRHLARAHERLTDLLWALEIGEVRLPSDGQGGQEVSTEWSGR
ncbi:hypothetical protein [Flindersiella endophytica]